MISYFSENSQKPSKSTLPKITVYIVTKNRFQLLEKALASVEAQTFRDFEIIVVDDGSVDLTPGFLSVYESGVKFRFFRNEVSKGAPAARNKAISEAEGEFITGLDDDDRFHTERLTKLMKAWDDSLSAVSSDDIFVREAKQIVWRKPQNVSFNDLLYRNLIGNQVLTRTEYLREIGGFDENLVAAQDYDLWLRLTEKFGNVRIVREGLQYVNISADNVRISTETGRKWGYYLCYLKHKSKMNKQQRKYHLYNIRRVQGKEKGLFGVLFWVPRKYWKKELGKIIFST